MTEGLRVWTKRPYFNDHPEVALALLKGQVGSDSEYLRRSARNALSDLRRTRPELAADL